MRITVFAVVALLSGCLPLPDYNTSLLVAPSAEAEMPAILEAVERVNTAVGREVWTVRAVDSASFRAGHTVIQVTQDDLGQTRRGVPRIGVANVTQSGVRITIPPGASARVIAHELGHAAGLGDVELRDNLMFHALVESWALYDDQIDCVRSWSAE